MGARPFFGAPGQALPGLPSKARRGALGVPESSLGLLACNAEPKARSAASFAAVLWAPGRLLPGISDAMAEAENFQSQTRVLVYAPCGQAGSCTARTWHLAAGGGESGSSGAENALLHLA